MTSTSTKKTIVVITSTMIFHIGLRIQKNHNKKHHTRLAQQKTGWFYLVLNMRTIRYWPRFLGRDNASGVSRGEPPTLAWNALLSAFGDKMSYSFNCGAVPTSAYCQRVFSSIRSFRNTACTLPHPRNLSRIDDCHALWYEKGMRNVWGTSPHRTTRAPPPKQPPT